MTDNILIRTTALPAAAASNDPAGLDLEVSPRVGPTNKDAFKFRLRRPATPNLANGTTITTVLQHSDTLVGGYVAVPGVAPWVTTGAGGVGAAAIDEFRLVPKATKRFVRAVDTVLTGGGSNVAVSTTFSGELDSVS